MAPKRKRRKLLAAKATSGYVSVYDHLDEGLGTFLQLTKFPGVSRVKETLTTLVGLLANYREEGHQLFPEVFILDDLTSALKTLPNSERVKIGSGARTPETVSLLIKRCAPLAQFGWSIYIWETNGVLEYGLLRCGLTALSLTASQQLIDEGDETLPSILIRQISNHTIEISGVNRNSLLIHFGVAQQPGQTPFAETREFCASIVADVPGYLKQQVQTFYWRVFERVLTSGHGCLAAVLNHSKRTLPLHLRDGVLIAPYLDVATNVGALLEAKVDACANDTRLRAIAALIRGMLHSDGVTVFRSDGSVMAYNVFVRSSKTSSKATFGGARRRAFNDLCTRIGMDVKSAFFLSQDGHAEFRGGTR